MNRYQKAIAAMAAIDLLLLLLFPPFLDNPMQRGMPRSFEGFYFLFMAPAGHHIDEPLLSIEILFVVSNALAAWLVLSERTNPANRSNAQPYVSEMAAARGLFLFGLINLSLIFLFPPFEPYSSVIRLMRQEGFDGFYFLLGDKRQRHLFLPFLYLEVIFVAVNLLTAWLMFSLIRGTTSATDEHLIEVAHHLPPEKIDALIHELEVESVTTTQALAPLGRKKERRLRQDPRYRGPERRHGHDRRHDTT
jgi:hypothetical protein